MVSLADHPGRILCAAQECALGKRSQRSMVTKRYTGFGTLIASLPLSSVLGMIWLGNEQPDVETLPAHAATFWIVLPSLPMFPLLRHGLGVWLALAAGLRADDCPGCSADVGLAAASARTLERLSIMSDHRRGGERR